MKLVARRAVAKIAIKTEERRRRKIPPAVIMCRIACDVETVIVNLLTIFEQSADSAVRAAHDLGGKSLPEKPVFHLQADRAAERVEAEDRIIRE